MEYPTQARVTVYDFGTLTMSVHWHNTYRQAVKFAKSLGGNKKIVIGAIDIIEVK